MELSVELSLEAERSGYTRQVVRMTSTALQRTDSAGHENTGHICCSMAHSKAAVLETASSRLCVSKKRTQNYQITIYALRKQQQQSDIIRT